MAQRPNELPPFQWRGTAGEFFVSTRLVDGENREGIPWFDERTETGNDLDRPHRAYIHDLAVLFDEHPELLDALGLTRKPG